MIIIINKYTLEKPYSNHRGTLMKNTEYVLLSCCEYEIAKEALDLTMRFCLGDPVKLGELVEDLLLMFEEFPELLARFPAPIARMYEECVVKGIIDPLPNNAPVWNMEPLIGRKQ